jgi:hypothetical protein
MAVAPIVVLYVVAPGFFVTLALTVAVPVP